MYFRRETDLSSAMALDPYRYDVGDTSEYVLMDEHTAAYVRPGVQSDIAGFLKPFTPVVNKLTNILTNE
ncbi:hypothetical protein Pcinc_030928 [Petrolisthes cinctipes]|uniref:Uncharacterized protein n=1 Tax=Petrolisthes cinctipes TaxID=88211 RepID=A0AAE1EXF0_PETCI|nr:hypothetical protein Pcinc_030928 [Petrolisthes cinctipes]